MYDLSVAQARMYEPVQAVRDKLQAFGGDVVTIGFGHLGDGNLHLLVADARPTQDDVRALLPLLCCAVLIVRHTTRFHNENPYGLLQRATQGGVSWHGS